MECRNKTYQIAEEGLERFLMEQRTKGCTMRKIG